MPEDLAEQCCMFYEALGFEPVDPPSRLLRRARWLESGETQIHLQYASSAEEPFTETPAPMSGHVAIVVDNYETAIGALIASGLEIDHRAAHWGAKRCFVQDPAGNALELMAAPPPGRQT